MLKGPYYYLGKDKKVYVGRDIAIAAKLVHDIDIKTKADLDEYVELRCAGIVRELHMVTVGDLVKLNEITKATILYKELHKCTLAQAETAVNEIITATQESKIY